MGACPECKGFGNILRYDERLVVPDPTRSLADGAVEPWTHPSGRWYQKQLLKAAKKRGVDLSRPYAELPSADREWVYAGADGYGGIQGFFEEVESYRYKLHVRVFLSRTQSRCPRCEGTRLKPEALSVKVGGATIAELCDRTIEDLAAFVEDLRLGSLEAAVARDVLRLLRAKLSFLLRVGLGYITLGRQTRTLSGGEAQRINLANQLGALTIAVCTKPFKFEGRKRQLQAEAQRWARVAVRARWCAIPVSALRRSPSISASRIWACSTSPAACQLVGSEIW